MILLISLVFSGRLISRSNVYNSLYFVSLRVQRVLKGSVPRRMHRHMRLLFHHTNSKLHPSRDTSRDPKFHTSSYGDTPSHQRRRPNNHNSRGHGGTAAATAAFANTASTGAQRSIWRKILQTWKKNWKVFQPQLKSFSKNYFKSISKGQLISKCPFGVFKSPKKPTNFFPGFLPWGQIKKIRTLYTPNLRILFWLSYTTFLIWFVRGYGRNPWKSSLFFWVGGGGGGGKIWRHQKDILKSNDL